MKNIELTEEEIDLIKIGLNKLDQYDLGIKCDYDNSDLMTIQFDMKLSSKEKLDKMIEIGDALDDVETQKLNILEPLLNKFSL